MSEAMPNRDRTSNNTFFTTAPTVLLLQMGLNEYIPKAFASALKQRGIQMEAVKVVEGHSPKRSNWEEYDGIILSGSTFMVTDRHPWSVRTGELMRNIVTRGITPVLGVCYGHQLLLNTFGASVAFMKERQIGSKDCVLTDAARQDPVFSIFGDKPSISVHVLHRQSVATIPDFVQVLVRNDVDACHACRLGPRCWTTQFHPELITANIRGIVEVQKDTLANDGLDYQKVRDSVSESSEGNVILLAFADVCLERNKERRCHV